MSKNNSGRMFVILSDEPETDYSYERLCDYYMAKQKETKIGKIKVVLTDENPYKNTMIHSTEKHEVGSNREKIKFAFLPIIVESRLKWLVKYKSIQKYVKEVIWDDFDYCYYNEYYWLEIERKLIRR